MAWIGHGLPGPLIPVKNEKVGEVYYSGKYRGRYSGEYSIV